MTHAPPESTTPAPANNVSDKPQAYRRLRIWPAILFLVILAVTEIIPWFTREADSSGVLFGIIMIGPLVSMAGILVWWLFASRATFIERLVGFF
jgi:Na+/melibiose symporter-like transporter